MSKHINKQLVYERRVKVQAYRAMHPEITQSELAEIFDVRQCQIKQDLAADLPAVIDYAARDAAIFADYQAGMDWEGLSEKYGLKTTTVKTISYRENANAKPRDMCSKDKKADIMWEELSRKGLVPARVS